MITKLDVVLCDFDEQVGGPVVAIPERRFVVHECAPVVLETGVNVS
jgi:hypothetical protein